jgi:hypothetical protein
MNKERDELEAAWVNARLHVSETITEDEWEAACCKCDDALDALTEFDRKQGDK